MVAAALERAALAAADGDRGGERGRGQPAAARAHTWGGGLAPTLLEISLLLPLIIQMVYGAYVWFRTPAAEHAVSAAQSGPFDAVG